MSLLCSKFDISFFHAMVFSVFSDLLEEIKTFKAELRKEADAEFQLMKQEKDELLQMIGSMGIEINNLKTSAKKCK